MSVDSGNCVDKKGVSTWSPHGNRRLELTSTRLGQCRREGGREGGRERERDVGDVMSSKCEGTVQVFLN